MLNYDFLNKFLPMINDVTLPLLLKFTIKIHGHDYFNKTNKYNHFQFTKQKI